MSPIDSGAPNARQAEHRNYRNKTTHFSWSTWIEGTCTLRHDLQKHFLAVLKLIGWLRHAVMVYSVHFWYWTFTSWSSYGQSTPVRTRYSLTSFMCPYHWLRLRLHGGQLSVPLTRYWFLIAGTAWLIYWNRNSTLGLAKSIYCLVTKCWNRRLFCMLVTCNEFFNEHWCNKDWFTLET